MQKAREVASGALGEEKGDVASVQGQGRMQSGQCIVGKAKGAGGSWQAPAGRGARGKAGGFSRSLHFLGPVRCGF